MEDNQSFIDEFISRPALAERWKCLPNTLRQVEEKGIGLVPVNLPWKKAVHYRLADVEKLEAQYRGEVVPADDPSYEAKRVAAVFDAFDAAVPADDVHRDVLRTWLARDLKVSPKMTADDVKKSVAEYRKEIRLVRKLAGVQSAAEAMLDPDDEDPKPSATLTEVFGKGGNRE